MAFSNQLPQLFILLVLLLPIAINGADLISQHCGKNYTNSDVLRGNINSVIAALISNTSAQAFADSSYGSGADAVYGISECRGDVTGQPCSNCISGAAQQLLLTCSNSAEMLILYQTCLLHIDTSNFIGKSNSTKIGAWFGGGKPADQQAFSRTVDELMIVVGSAAVYGEKRKFGWGKIENNQIAEKTIYGMVQCTWDLSDAECTQCFSDALEIEKKYCDGFSGCFVITRSCSLRFDTSAFLGALDPATPTRAITVSSL